MRAVIIVLMKQTEHNSRKTREILIQSFLLTFGALTRQNMTQLSLTCYCRFQCEDKISVCNSSHRVKMQDCAKIEDSDNPAMAPTFTVLTSSDAVIGAFMIHQMKATSVSSQHLRHTTGRNRGGQIQFQTHYTVHLIPKHTTYHITTGLQGCLQYL